MEWKKNLMKAKIFPVIHGMVKQLTGCAACRPKVLAYIAEHQKKGGITPESVEEHLKPLICNACNTKMEETGLKTFNQLQKDLEGEK